MSEIKRKQSIMVITKRISFPFLFLAVYFYFVVDKGG